MQEIANKIFSMTELRRKTSDVLEHLVDGPVVISENGKAHSVIVSATEWDQIVKMLRRTEFLEDEIDVLRCELAVERGEVELKMSQPNGKQYQLKYASGVEVAIKLLAHNVRKMVIEAINELCFDPEPVDSIQLRDPYVTHRRIAIGRHRIVYKVKEDDGQVWIISVKKRSPSTYNYLTQN